MFYLKFKVISSPIASHLLSTKHQKQIPWSKDLWRQVWGDWAPPQRSSEDWLLRKMQCPKGRVQMCHDLLVWCHLCLGTGRILNNMKQTNHMHYSGDKELQSSEPRALGHCGPSSSLLILSMEVALLILANNHFDLKWPSPGELVSFSIVVTMYLTKAT